MGLLKKADELRALDAEHRGARAVVRIAFRRVVIVHVLADVVAEPKLVGSDSELLEDVILLINTY